MLHLGFTDATHSCPIWERLFHITLSTPYQDKRESTVALLGYMRDHFPVPSKSHMLASHLFISHAIAPGKLCASHKEGLDGLLKAIGTVPELPRIPRTYLLIAQHLCQVNALHLLPFLIDTMVAQEATVSPHLFGVALNRCFAENNLEMADIVHKRLISLNIPITRPLYSCIVSGLYKVFRSKEAFDMYRAMRNAGHSPILGLAIKLFGLSHKLGDHEFKRWLINDTIDPHGSNGSLTKEEILEFKKVIQSRGCLPKKDR
ncbi:hypothetical protein DSO57_1036697 [Entomophthora muscae]|uniref:Uncharacterized protein n=1 Tax=Entomophthora muscae TaxID=34485 RepID=A0ACC2S1C2_9FUNG|nr:hypothetical protein DSO57_1036697 [Entomophthora muscae]